MASGGEGFGTERARLAGDGLSTERARLAQGGYRGQGFGTERARLAHGGFLGQFYKRAGKMREEGDEERSSQNALKPDLFTK